MFLKPSRYLFTTKNVIKLRAEATLKTMDYPWYHDVHNKQRLDLQEFVKSKKTLDKKKG